MASKQPERIAFRRKWKLLNAVTKVFGIAFFAIIIIGAIYLSPWLGCLLGSVFLFGGGLFFVIMGPSMKKKNEEWVKHYGIPIQAAISGFETRNAGMSRSSWIKVYSVKLTWTSPQGRSYTFEQDLGEFPTRPASLDQHYAPGTFLIVYIDPDDPSFYTVRL